MKYRSFKRLVVQIVPEPQETISPGGIVLPESHREVKNIAHGKVLDGSFGYSPGSDPYTSVPTYAVKPGDTVAFSKAGAMNDGKGVYFLSEEQVLAVVVE